jgi:hypothetical protein
MSNDMRLLAVTVGCVLCGLTLLGSLVPTCQPPPHARGNFAALRRCHQIGLIVRQEFNAGRKDASAWGEQSKQTLGSSTTLLGAGHARFLVRTNLNSDRPFNTVLAVCEQPFDNVPLPTLMNLFRRNPAHAVAYADGSTNLISPTAFAQLDLSGFVATTNFSNSNKRP